MVCTSIPLSLPNSLTRYMIITSDSHVCTDTLIYTLAFFPRNTVRSLIHDSGRQPHAHRCTIAGAVEAYGTCLFTRVAPITANILTHSNYVLTWRIRGAHALKAAIMCFVVDSVSPARKSAAEVGNFLLAGELAAKDGLVGFGRRPTRRIVVQILRRASSVLLPGQLLRSLRNVCKASGLD